MAGNPKGSSTYQLFQWNYRFRTFHPRWFRCHLHLRAFVQRSLSLANSTESEATTTVRDQWHSQWIRRICGRTFPIVHLLHFQISGVDRNKFDVGLKEYQMQWWDHTVISNNYLYHFPLEGTFVKHSCVFGINDLPNLVRRPELMVHKMYLDFQPAG